MLSSQAMRTADEYWASFFGCAPGRLRSSEPAALAHAGELADYEGIYLLRRVGAAPVVSLPPALAHLGSRVADAARNGLADDARWAGLLGARLERVVGPAWIGYADAQTLRTAPAHGGTRLLADADRPALEALRRACTPTEWEHGGSPGTHPVMGAFDGVELAAVASFAPWGERIAHIGVVTHPAQRGRGFGRGVVGAIAALALERALVPQYRTLASNTPSRRVADALGFQGYAETLALRLSPSRT